MYGFRCCWFYHRFHSQIYDCLCARKHFFHAIAFVVLRWMSACLCTICVTLCHHWNHDKAFEMKISLSLLFYETTWIAYNWCVMTHGGCFFHAFCPICLCAYAFIVFNLYKYILLCDALHFHKAHNAYLFWTLSSNREEISAKNVCIRNGYGIRLLHALSVQDKFTICITKKGRCSPYIHI